MAEDFDDYEDFEVEDECLDDFLKQYTNLKTTGVICGVPEARKWYVKILEETQKNLNTALGLYLLNTSQKIPYSKLYDEEMETMIDDGCCVSEYITVFNNLLQVIHELYKHPKDYNAWRGEVLVNKEVEGKVEKVKDLAYYIEHRNVDKSDEDSKELYI